MRFNQMRHTDDKQPVYRLPLSVTAAEIFASVLTVESVELRHRENLPRIWVFDFAARRITTHIDVFRWIEGIED